MNSGFVKLHRKITKWEWYTDQPTARLFFHLLLTANYKDSRYKGFSVPAGSVASGRKVLSEQTGLSQQQVRTAINKLKSTSEITIHSTNKFSIISITNWQDYQEGNQQSTNNQPTSNQQVTTSKERKKKRTVAEKPCGVSQQIWDDYITVRKTKLTNTALDRIQLQADKVGWSLEEALAESAARGWQGFKADWVETKKKAGVCL